MRKKKHPSGNAQFKVKFIGKDEDGYRVYSSNDYETAHKFACRFKPWGMITKEENHWKIKI